MKCYKFVQKNFSLHMHFKGLPQNADPHLLCAKTPLYTGFEKYYYSSTMGDFYCRTPLNPSLTQSYKHIGSQR